MTIVSGDPSKATYSILPSSTLSLSGTTNVNNFQCHCTKSWGSYPVSFKTNKAGTCWYFNEVGLSIPVKSLDCRHKQISKDLEKALEAEKHPYIHFRVLEALRKEECAVLPIGECLTTIIDLEIEIAGVNRHIELEVDCYFIDENKYHFSAYHEINMKDFKIEPPTALFGMIQVNPEILIDIDLRVKIHYS